MNSDSDIFKLCRAEKSFLLEKNDSPEIKELTPDNVDDEYLYIYLLKKNISKKSTAQFIVYYLSSDTFFFI